MYEKPMSNSNECDSMLCRLNIYTHIYVNKYINYADMCTYVLMSLACTIESIS